MHGILGCGRIFLSGKTIFRSSNFIDTVLNSLYDSYSILALIEGLEILEDFLKTILVRNVDSGICCSVSVKDMS